MNFALYRKFIVWWVSVLLIGTSVFWANYFGIVQTIWINDETKLALITSIVFVIANLILGWTTWRSVHNEYDPLSKRLTGYCWYVAEMLMALGMLGTVIGLIHMLEINAKSAGQIDPAMVAGMWKAMGLALYTNAVGLIGSIVLSFQLKTISLVGDHHETV